MNLTVSWPPSTVEIRSIFRDQRPTMELTQLRHTIKGTELRHASLEREQLVHDLELRRFSCQIQAQRDRQLQIVTSSDGTLTPGQIQPLPALLSHALLQSLSWNIASVAVAIGATKVHEKSNQSVCRISYVESADIAHHMQADGGFRQLEPTIQLQSDGYRWTSAPVSDSPHCVRVHPNIPTDRLGWSNDRLRLESFRISRFDHRVLSSRKRCRATSAAQFARLHPYQTSLLPTCSLSIFAHRFGNPTRDSFPYRTTYLFRTAFPHRSILYTTPYAGNAPPFRGLRYSDHRDGCWLD